MEQNGGLVVEEEAECRMEERGNGESEDWEERLQGRHLQLCP